MSDAVLAAMIAAGATLITSLLQLKTSFKREVAARAQIGKRKTRGPFLLLVIMLVAAGVGGFALSQWAMESERATAASTRRDLQNRVDVLSRTANELLQTRGQARTEIETGVLRRLGAEGSVAMTTVAPCKPPQASTASSAISPGASGASNASASGPPNAAPAASPASSAGNSGCAESDATQVLVCAPIPARASIASVELYTRFADSDTAWSASRGLPGQELEQARFSEKPVELSDDQGRQVCHGFANWSTQRARVVRVVVRFTL